MLSQLNTPSKTPDIFKLPALGAPLTFEAEGGLDRGAIDNFCKTRQLGRYVPIDPEFVRLLLKNQVEHLWIYERPGRWQMRRYLVDLGALLAWWNASAKIGAPWLMIGDDGEEWMLLPAHLFERRRFTRNGGKVQR